MNPFRALLSLTIPTLALLVSAPTPLTAQATAATAAQSMEPSTARTKLLYHANSAAGPLTLLGAAAYGGIRQWSNSPREWGQGAEGYGKRVGSYMAYSGIRNVVGLGLDGALREDPRYVHSEASGFWNRTGHALRMTFVTRTDSGGETFAVWRFGSAYSAAFISNEWYPDRLNTVGRGFSQGSIQIGYDALLNIATEFWPDVRKKLRHH